MMHNVLPSAAVLERYPFLRGAIPEAVLQGRRFPITRVQDVALAERQLNRPGVIGPPSGLPLISQAMPRFSPTLSAKAVGPENLERLKGMTLPRQAERPLTPFMRQQIGLQRQMEGLPRIETRPEFRPLARPEIISRVPGQDLARPRQKFSRLPARALQPALGPTAPEVIRGPGSRKFPPPGSSGFQPAPSREFRQPVGGGVRAVSPRKFRQTSGFRASVPREFRAAPPPVFRSEPRAAFGTRAISPAPRGSAPARTFSPPSHGR